MVVLIVGKIVCKVVVEEVVNYIVGYVLVNDVSLLEESFYCLVIKVKCCDGFCFIGMLLVVCNVDDLIIIIEINGCEVDSWYIGDLQCSVVQLLSVLSEFVIFNFGDVIFIGMFYFCVMLCFGDCVCIFVDGFLVFENLVVVEGELV